MKETMALNVIPDDFVPAGDSFPFPSPFTLSSVERDWCMGQPERIVYIKRAHLQRNLLCIAKSIGMTTDEQKKFLDHYCSPSLRNAAEIRAERDEYFNLRSKAEAWMEKRAPAVQPGTSRIEQYAKTSNVFKQLVHGFFGSGRKEPANGDSNTPDEQ